MRSSKLSEVGGGSGISRIKVVKMGAGNAAKFNQGSLMRTTDAATGAAARKGAARLGVTGKKGVQKPISINTAVKSSPKDKATARGLKAANKPTKAGKVMKKTTSTKKMQDVPAGVSARFAATNARLAKEAAKKKSK
jgi:hypothetical protein